MAAGVVKFFNDDRGYGFIKPDDGSKDIFVHISALRGSDMATLVEGQKLTFDVENDPKGKGLRAVRVKRG